MSIGCYVVQMVEQQLLLYSSAIVVDRGSNPLITLHSPFFNIILVLVP